MNKVAQPFCCKACKAAAPRSGTELMHLDLRQFSVPILLLAGSRAFSAAQREKKSHIAAQAAGLPLE
jgi:hypothetical protein